MIVVDKECLQDDSQLVDSVCVCVCVCYYFKLQVCATVDLVSVPDSHFSSWTSRAT